MGFHIFPTHIRVLYQPGFKPTCMGVSTMALFMIGGALSSGLVKFSSDGAMTAVKEGDMYYQMLECPFWYQHRIDEIAGSQLSWTEAGQVSRSLLGKRPQKLENPRRTSIASIEEHVTAFMRG